jgi:membrane fusion protein (multidrug efflux system)
VVDPATSTIRLTLLLDDGAAGARVGGFAKVRITTDTRHEALALPKLALVEEGGLRSVFVAEADSVRKVEVRTGLYDESHIEVLEGVEEGEFVVTLGQGGLRTGTKIEALNGPEVGYAPEAAPESHLAKAGQSVAAATADQ